MEWRWRELVKVERPSDPNARRDVQGHGEEGVVGDHEEEGEEELAPKVDDEGGVNGTANADRGHSDGDAEANTKAEAVEGSREAVGEGVFGDQSEEDPEAKDLDGSADADGAKDLNKRSEHEIGVPTGCSSNTIIDGDHEDVEDDQDDDLEGEGEIHGDDAKQEAGHHLLEGGVAGAAHKVEEEPDKRHEGEEGKEKGEGQSLDGGEEAENGKVDGEAAKSDEDGPEEEGDDEEDEGRSVLGPDDLCVSRAGAQLDIIVSRDGLVGGIGAHVVV